MEGDRGVGERRGWNANVKNDRGRQEKQTRGAKEREGERRERGEDVKEEGRKGKTTGGKQEWAEGKKSVESEREKAKGTAWEGKQEDGVREWCLPFQFPLHRDRYIFSRYGVANMQLEHSSTH